MEAIGGLGGRGRGRPSGEPVGSYKLQAGGYSADGASLGHTDEACPIMYLPPVDHKFHEVGTMSFGPSLRPGVHHRAWHTIDT